MRSEEKFNEFYFVLAENEEIESSAIHPSGDCFILAINWNTNTHTLYRMENREGEIRNA